MTNALEELNIINSKEDYNQNTNLELSDLDADLGGDIFENQESTFVDTLDEDMDLETFDTNVDLENQNEQSIVEEVPIIVIIYR